MSNKRNFLSACMLGILLLSAAGKLDAIGVGFGIGGRGGGIYVGTGTSGYYDDCDDCEYPYYYSYPYRIYGHRVRRGYHRGGRFYRGGGYRGGHRGGGHRSIRR